MTALPNEFKRWFSRVVFSIDFRYYHFGVNVLFLFIFQCPCFYVTCRFGASDKTPVLLTFLKTLPEEVQSSHLRIGENRRRAVNIELAQKTQTVIQFLVSFSYVIPANLMKSMLIFFCSAILFSSSKYIYL